MLNKVKKYKMLLLELNLKQTELAVKLNVSRQRVNDIISGRSSFTEEQQRTLCKELNVNLNWLIADEGEMFIVK